MVTDGTTRPASGEADSRAQGMLLIAYHFPPSAAVGGRRAANFGSALRSLGWKTHVLTIPDSAVEQIDRSRLSTVEGLPIHTAAVWPTIVGLVTAAVKLRPRRSAPAAGTVKTPPRREPSGRQQAHEGESMARRLRRYVMAFALLPDAAKGWLVPAVAGAVRLIRRHELGWFMTSCPPYSVHVIGLAVKALTGARWVVDYRDPWMTTGSKRLYPTCAASIAIESWLERRVIENADLVVFNVDRLRNAYRSRYSHVPAEKFVFIPNAITARPPSEPVRNYDHFTICYTGSLYVGRSPVPVFEAVSRLVEARLVPRDAIRIKLVGQCRFIDGVPTEAVIRERGLESVVEVHDHLPYAEAFEMVRRSHLALLLAPNLPYQIPAKVYDYLGAGTRILAVAEEGGTADLVKESGAGAAFAGEDVDGIAAFILGELRRGPQPHAASLIDRFDVSRLTRDLVGHLERVAGDEAPHGVTPRGTPTDRRSRQEC